MDIQTIKKEVGKALKYGRYLRMLKKPVINSSILQCGNCCGIMLNSDIYEPSMKNYALCQYILTDDILPDYFIKRPEQKVISFGTYDYTGNFDKIRRTYLSSDYIICENASEFAERFRLNNTYTGLLIEDKNAVFGILGGIMPDGKKVTEDDEKKIVIYSGSLSQNGITTSLLNLLSQLSEEELKKICLTFRSESITDNSLNIEGLRKSVDIIPMHNGTKFTLTELICYWLYFKKNFDKKFVKKRIDRLYKREWKRLFGCINTGCAVQFTGYEYGMINLFRCSDCQNVIYVHNNMPEEIKNRHNQHLLTLERAYNEYSVVALVTEDMRIPTMKISKSTDDNFVVVPNCHDHRAVLAKAEFPVEFQNTTECNVSKEELIEILNSDKVKFITIGRFSPEKAHMRLMKAFERFSDSHPESVLIIIGGRGELFETTLQYAQNSKSKIIVIKSMQNPMPVLKKCDLFMLPSRYEGLGLVLLEADTLQIPVFATDIDGPRGFLKANGGMLVPDTSEGIFDGMLLFASGKIMPMNVDYDVYNKKASDIFRKITNLSAF